MLVPGKCWNFRRLRKYHASPGALSGPFRARQNNEQLRRPTYDGRLSREQCITMARLRAGKAIFNSKHYFENTEYPKCNHCNIDLTINHILVECPISKIEQPLEKLLACANAGNLPAILESLRKHGLDN
ncbi:hypothetical protein EVAR_66613_1 [Eumeta japonica]|uniref:Uncharacterized protein n=1 Tax=Eumeta variegata TaxID=151549 RepID=A0A4C2AAT6_EUMVA|nr:hypothetical protein EVAR_66613_1 [Eumeta japonica]